MGSTTRAETDGRNQGETEKNIHKAKSLPRVAAATRCDLPLTLMYTHKQAFKNFTPHNLWSFQLRYVAMITTLLIELSWGKESLIFCVSFRLPLHSLLGLETCLRVPSIFWPLFALSILSGLEALGLVNVSG